jgi:tetratricopeptide (TPR) repeat protein
MAWQASDDKKPKHLYYSALAYMLAGDNQRCLAQFDKLLATGRQVMKPAWKENLVHALLADGKPRRALPFICELAATYAGDKQIQWQEILIYQYLQLNMKTEALALARRLTVQAPTEARWWKALAHLELDRQDYRRALVALVVYSYLEPLNRQERKLLADLYLQLDIPAKAAPAYDACLEQKPQPSLVRCLALAYQRLGKPGKALKTIDRYAATGKDPDLAMIRADLLYRLGRWKEAAAAYSKVARSDYRNKGRAWLMAGYAAWQARDLEACRRAFKKASRYSRNKKMALAALEQIEEVQAQ